MSPVSRAVSAVDRALAVLATLAHHGSALTATDLMACPGQTFTLDSNDGGDCRPYFPKFEYALADLFNHLETTP